VLLPHVDDWAEGRRAAAANYAAAGLGELADLPSSAPGVEPAWHLYMLRHERADDIAAALAAADVGCRAYYRTPIHRQEAMRPYAGAELPVTDELARTHLAIPMSPVLSEQQAGKVTQAVAQA
jgi:dTDP-3-amino-3,4,6-trideoxy-alpha-D-glucose transaminase